MITDQPVLNAVITGAFVGRNDRDMVELVVTALMSDGFSGMLEGHHSLYLPPSYTHHEPKSLLAHIVHHWLEVTECKNVSDMVGKTVRVQFEKRGLTTPCRVGHIVRNDLWFSTDEICKAVLA